MPDDVAAVSRMYELLKWLLPRIDNFPRSRRFTLGDRIENTATEILMALVEAQYTRERKALLESANRDIAKLRFLLRMCLDTGIWSTGQYEHASVYLVDVGRQVGGWSKQSA